MVVDPGVTVTLLSAATVPTPLSIVRLSAPVVIQLRVADPPAVIVGGTTEKLSIVGDAGLTVTVTVEVAVPPGPVAANVYMVVVVGLTVLLPSAGRFGPPLIDMLSALVVAQLKVADSPAAIVDGTAEKLSTVGARK